MVNKKPTPVFLPGESHGQRSLVASVPRITNSWTLLKRLSMHATSLVAQLVKNLPAMQETWVQSLSWDDPLEKGTATHSSILA